MGRASIALFRRPQRGRHQRTPRLRIDGNLTASRFIERRVGAVFFLDLTIQRAAFAVRRVVLQWMTHSAHDGPQGAFDGMSGSWSRKAPAGTNTQAL